MLGHHGQGLKATTMALATTREEIDQTRQTATLSWLQSAPLIDEVEKQQETLARTKKQVAMATTVIASLGSLLETTTKEAELKEGEDCKNQAVIEELRKAWQREKNDMDRLVADTEERKREKMKLKTELGIKKQSLRALQLRFKAVRMEVEALKSSKDFLLDQEEDMKYEHELIAISREEFWTLHRKVENQKALANSRVAASDEQRHAAEQRKVRAKKRLEMLHKDKRLKESLFPQLTSNARNNEISQEHRVQAGLISRRNKKAHKKKKSNIVQKIIRYLCSKGFN